MCEILNLHANADVLSSIGLDSSAGSISTVGNAARGACSISEGVVHVRNLRATVYDENKGICWDVQDGSLNPHITAHAVSRQQGSKHKRNFQFLTDRSLMGEIGNDGIMHQTVISNLGTGPLWIYSFCLLSWNSFDGLGYLIRWPRDIMFKVFRSGMGAAVLLFA